MPVARVERGNVRRIADEVARLAETLRRYPEAAGARSVRPSKAILTSMRKINATLATGALEGRLGTARFSAIGREFAKIGKTLGSLGGARAKTQRKTARKRATRRTTTRKRIS